MSDYVFRDTNLFSISVCPHRDELMVRSIQILHSLLVLVLDGIPATSDNRLRPVVPDVVSVSSNTDNIFTLLSLTFSR